MPYSTRKRPFHLTTPLDEDALLLHRFEGNEALSAPFEFRLSMVSEDEAIDPADLVGKRVTLWANREDEDDEGGTCWSGIVASFGRSGSQWFAGGGESQEMTSYEATLVPWFWQLKLVEDCRIFQNLSIPDIVNTILGELQLGRHETDLSGNYEPLEYCVQYGESSFDFISRLLEDAGIHYFFYHDASEPADVLVLSDRQEKDYQEQVTSLRYAANWAEQDEPVVFALARQQHMRTGQVTMRDYDFTKPTQNLETGVDTVLEVGAERNLPSFRYPGGYLERDHGDARARLAMEIEEAAHELLDGASTQLEIHPGVAFQLYDSPSEVLDPPWRTLHVHHRGENNLDDDNGESFYQNNFTVMPLAMPYRPERRTRKPRMRGPQTAVVTGPDNEEIYTDQHGRVKVHFFWDHLGETNDKSSCWIRVSQAWAGRGWGTFFLPRIGMEVIVDFLDGDPDRPLVTGCVYNGDNNTPYELPKHATISTLKTNSSKGSRGYNELRFVDRKGSEQLMMHAQNRMDICVNGTFCECNGGERDLHVGKDFDIKVGGDVNWINESAWYESIAESVDLQITGDVRQIYESSVVQRIASMLDINSDQYSLVVESDINLKSADLVAEVSGDLKVRGGGIVLEGSNGGITLKCGPSFITIKNDGVTIEGPMVKINCGGDAAGASPAQPAEAVEITDPLEPLSCSCGTPGEGRSGGGGPRTHTSRTVQPHNPPNWRPPTPPPTRLVCEPPETSDTPCSIKELDVVCEHGSRHPDPASRILQVVPSSGATTGRFGITLNEELKIKLKASKKSGGSDLIEVRGTAVDGSSAPIHTAQSRTPSPPSDADFTNGATLSTSIESPDYDNLWAYPCEPDVHYFYGKGCDDKQLSLTVEVYPCVEYSGSITIDTFEDVFEKNLFDNNGFSLDLKVSGPTGDLTVSWGWKENDDWRAYYFAKASADVTFITVDVSGTIDLLKWLIDGSLMCFGIPAGTVQTISNFLKRLHLGDESTRSTLAAIDLTLGLKGSIGLECDIEWKRFTNGAQETAPSATLKGTLAIYARLYAAFTPAELISVKIKGTAQGKLEVSGGLSIEDDGLHMKPALDFLGLTLELEFELTLMRIDTDGSYEWEALPSCRLWPNSSDPTPPDWHLLSSS